MNQVNKIQYTVGDKIGSCTYMGDTKRANANWKRFANFKCECGIVFESQISKVKCGHTKSCGCLVIKKITDFNRTHDKSKTPEFNTWVGIKQRCYNRNNPRYGIWGGRGITVCQRWLESFDNFLDDMGERPTPYHTLDRVENDKGYYKQNCRWATPKQQALNRRSNFIITYMGQSKPLKVWTDELGLSYFKVIQRIKKLNWSPEKALTA